MSDNIELVIKINKDIAQDIINGENDEPRNIVRAFQATIAAAIKYGTPLPKGHGELIDQIRADIEQVKSIMNEEIINHNRKDLVNFVNGLNQSLAIIDKYKAECEEQE